MSTVDLQLAACLEPWMNLRFPDQFKTAQIQMVSQAYQRNGFRTYQMTLFPAAMVSSMVLIHDMTLDFQLRYKAQVDSGKLTRQQVDAFANEALGREIEARTAILMAGGQDAHDLRMRDVNVGFGGLTGYLQKDLRDGAQGWLAAQITGMWTAFEALAEDVWEAALNAYPTGLADLDGKKGTGEKTVPLWELKIHNYDLSNKMGTILKKKRAFDKIDEIRNSYEQAFGEHGPGIVKLLDNNSLDALSAVRNVMVHSGGIIDDKYVSRTTSLDQCPKGPKGTPIELTGPIVSSLVSPVLQLGADLLALVDEWLAAKGVV